MVWRNKSGRLDVLDPAFAVCVLRTMPDGGRRMQTMQKDYLNRFVAMSKLKARFVRFRLCMSMEWMNECVDGLFITQLLKA